MAPSPSSPAPLLWVANSEARDLLLQLLKSHDYAPRTVSTPAETLQALKGQDQATVFVDCQTVSTYGAGLYAKIKVACPRCRLVLLCDKGHHEHRDLIKEAMALGIYACLLAPVSDWEVLAMVRRGPPPRPSGRRPPRTR